MNTDTAVLTNGMASPELAEIEVNGVTRSAFLLRGTLAAGAVYGGLMVGPFARQAMAAMDTSDVDILNFALTLEYLETAFYKKSLKLGLKGDTLKLAKLLYTDEAAHVKALTGTIKDLGGKPVASPSFKFPITNESSFLKLAQTLEDTGVSAYNGAAPMIKDKKVLAAAGSIVQVEGRHAAAIRLMRGQAPAPNAFDKTMTKAQVTKAITPLIQA